MRKNNRIFVTSLAALFMMSAVACSGNADVTTPVAGENVVVPEATQQPIKEVAPNATYVEANGLVFEEDTKIETKGILYSGEDLDNFDIIDVGWEVTNISISDAENGVQTVIIEQEAEGYIWSDSDGVIYKTNLNIPTGRLCDIYTGIMIPVGKAKTETAIEWNGMTWKISASESASWEDADWATGWIESPDGEGKILPSILKVRTEITVTEGYEGLALILVPITDAYGSVYGEKIMDAWTEDSYLFNVNELIATFKNIEEEGKNTTDLEVVAEVTVSPAPTANPTEKPTEEGKEGVEAIPQPTEQPMHVHQYSSKVTVQPNCVNTGTRLYSCECGSFYTESINATGHDYSVPITQTVHHDEQWDSVARTVYVKKIRCSCGEYFTETATWDTHRATNILAEGIYSSCAGAYMVVEEPETVYENVKISDAYDEEVTVGYKCSVCGQQK